MKMRNLAAFLVAASIFLTVPISGSAQNPEQPQVSVVNLQVVANPDGSQSVVTPKGDLAFLPGKGVNGNVAQIYMGSQGGFWYVDRSGQTVDLNPAVESLKARRARAGQVPQYAPMPDYNAYGGNYGQPAPQQYGQQPYGQQQYAQQQIQQQQQQQQQQTQSTEDDSSNGRRGGGVLSAVGTAAAAGVGAMAGAALTNNGYYNAPYGTPYYYGNGGRPYYYDHNNERRDLDDLSPNQKAVMYNKHQINQKNQQAAFSQAQSNHQSRQHENYQQQQQWYSSQLKESPHKFQRSESNPFANERSSGQGFGGGERGSRSVSRGGGRSFSGGGGRARGGGGGRRR